MHVSNIVFQSDPLCCNKTICCKVPDEYREKLVSFITTPMVARPNHLYRSEEDKVDSKSDIDDLATAPDKICIVLGRLQEYLFAIFESGNMALKSFPMWSEIADIARLCSQINPKNNNSAFRKEEKLSFFKMKQMLSQNQHAFSVQCVFWRHFLHCAQYWSRCYITLIMSRFPVALKMLKKDS